MKPPWSVRRTGSRELALRPVLAVLLLTSLTLSGCLAQSHDPRSRPDSVPVAGNGPNAARNGTATPISVSNVTVVNGSAWSATIAYTVQGPSEVTSWIEYGPVNGNLSDTANRTGPGDRNRTIRRLHENTTYRYRIRAKAPQAGPANSTWRTFHTAPVNVTIQPGIRIAFEEKLPGSGGSCTLAFILESDKADVLYGLTAGHCLDDLDPGNPVYTATGAPGPWWTLPDREPTGPWVVFGFVEIAEWEDDPDQEGHQWYDWGLVRLRDGIRARVESQVRYWDGPTGVSPKGDLDPGDPICHYGQEGAIGLPREARDRCGSFATYYEGGTLPEIVLNGSSFGGPGMDWFVRTAAYSNWGDSGSPVIDHRTGQAVGIMSRNIGGPGKDMGPTLYSILDRAEEVGYDLRLLTAEYGSPPPPSPV